MEIFRKLACIERDGAWKEVRQDRIDRLFGSVVAVLGDPGMGKTTLLRRLGQGKGMTYVHAADLLLADDPGTLIPEDARPVVDGLDEIACPGTGSAVAAVLERLDEAESMPPVLACRAAEWRGAADLARLEDAYVDEPTVLYLTPFDGDEAREFLAGEFPGCRVDALLRHVGDSGLARAWGNPLVLRLLGEAARGGDDLPGTRAELLDRGCRAMAGRDIGAGIALPVGADEDELLLAAGAVCATLLLCDLRGVHDGLPAATPAGCANVADFVGLPLAGAAADALATRLFRAEGGGRFSYFHRAVAEYLGARWLTRCIDEGVADERVLAPFEAGGGVPTALRCLHAWLARLGPVLAGRCIAADPYAVLRDGETETLDLERARALLAALGERSGEDPWFDTENRGAPPALGLMRAELKDDIVGLLAVPGRHAEAAALLADSMGGTELWVEAGWMLKGMVFDRDREHGERFAAMNTLRLAGALDDKEGAVLRLLGMGDAVSARLACELLAQWGDDVVPAAPESADGGGRLRLVVGGAGEPEARSVEVCEDDPFGALDAARLAAALDGIAAGASAMMAEADVPERSAFTDLMRRLAARVLEADPAVAPQRVWAWIGWTRQAEGDGGGARECLAAVLRKQRALRTALHEHVLLTPGEDASWVGERELEVTGLGLCPVEDDVAALREAARARAAVDPEVRRRLWVLRRSAGGTDRWPGVAEEEAAALDGAPPIDMPGWTMEETDEAETAAKPLDGRALRRSLAGKEDPIAAGDVGVLAAPAAVWLGRCDVLGGRVDRDPSVLPDARLREVLGAELGERVLAGFVAVLRRDDLPGAAEIARADCSGEEHEAAAPLICGAAVALGGGLPLDVVARATLEAACMAWLRAPRGASDRLLESIGSTLEGMVLRSGEDMERHFRDSIEPQLAGNAACVPDLDRLAEYCRFTRLAIGLSVEWLRKYPELNGTAQADLIECAIESAPREALRDLIGDCRGTVLQNRGTRQKWLSAACLVDPEGSREALLAAADDPDFLGHVRDAIGDATRFADAPLDSLVFVVEAFGARWPRVPELPGDDGMGHGWSDPRDASAFIERTIHAIANRPQPEATDALRNLIENHAPSYAGTLKRALAFQRKARRDCEQEILTVAGFQALMEGIPMAAVEPSGVHARADGIAG